MVKVFGAVRQMAGVGQMNAVRSTLKVFSDKQLASILDASVADSSRPLLVSLLSSSESLDPIALAQVEYVSIDERFNVAGCYLHVSRQGRLDRGHYIGMGSAGHKKGGVSGFKNLGGILKRIIKDHGSAAERHRSTAQHYKGMYLPNDTYADHQYCAILYFLEAELDELLVPATLSAPSVQTDKDISKAKADLRQALIGILESALILATGFYRRSDIAEILKSFDYVPPHHRFKTHNRSPGLEAFSESSESMGARSKAGGLAAAEMRRAGGSEPVSLHTYMKKQFGHDFAASMVVQGGHAARDRHYLLPALIWSRGDYLQVDFRKRDHPQLEYCQSGDPSVLACLPAEVRDTKPQALRLQLGVHGKGSDWARPPAGTTVWLLDAGQLENGLPLTKRIVMKGFRLADQSLLGAYGRVKYLSAAAVLANPGCLVPLERVPGDHVEFSWASAGIWDADPNVKRRKARPGNTEWDYRLRFRCFVGWLRYAYQVGMDLQEID